VLGLQAGATDADKKNFTFDAIYDWKYVPSVVPSSLSLSLSLPLSFTQDRRLEVRSKWCCLCPLSPAAIVPACTRTHTTYTGAACLRTNLAKCHCLAQATAPTEKCTHPTTPLPLPHCSAKQQDIYDETARPIVGAVLDGFNGTIFAYGQTGTGKTFTMEGVRTDPALRGIIPNSFDHIFNQIARCTEGQQFLVRASYLEIYTEEIRDLLSKNHTEKLVLKEKPDSGVYVKDLSSFVVKSVKEIDHVMNVGNKNRKVGATEMNAESSRSHAIFIITIECSELGVDGENHIRVGKLNLVDLAGSERLSKTKADGERKDEGIKINQSLSCLGNVIKALVDGGGKAHIPYRDSKLTRLLQDSLGGNAKTVMIANMGPADFNYDETVTTLRYANRAKNIKNKPKINEDPKDALLREFQDQLSKLKDQLDKKRGGPGTGGGKTKKKKKIRKYTNEHGEEVEVEEDEDEDPAEAEAEEKRLYEEQRMQLDEEKKALAENQAVSVEEKSKMAEIIAARTAELETEKKAKKDLAKQIKAMEGKLLVGGKTIHDRTSEQERKLQKQREEMAAQRVQERELAQKLKEEKEKQMEKMRAFDSKEQEREVTSKKLKKLWAKLQAAKGEKDDEQEEFERAREEMYQTTRDLQRELKLRQMIIEHFIPPDEAKKVEERAEFDAELDQWHLKPLGFTTEGAAAIPVQKRPISAIPGSRHAITQDAQQRAAIDRNPRYRPENIFLVELEMPERTTQDYIGPRVDPRVQAAIDNALRPEDDLVMEAQPDDFLAAGMERAKAAKRAARARSKSGSSHDGDGDGGGDEGSGESRSRTKSSKHRSKTKIADLDPDSIPESKPTRPLGRPAW
jgi:kinesin family protein 3/17